MLEFARVFGEFFKGVEKVVSNVFQDCFREVSGVCQECFKEIVFVAASRADGELVVTKHMSLHSGSRDCDNIVKTPTQPQLNLTPNLTKVWVLHENDFAHHHHTPPLTQHQQYLSCNRPNKCQNWGKRN